MIQKPTLLYASPLPPQKSGISDYSVVLIKALSKVYDITLYIDNYEIEEKSLEDYKVVKYGVDYIDYEKYDYRIYNIGNNPWFHKYIYEAALSHPGMVILHDMVLYFLFVGYYQEKGELYSKTFSHQGLDDFITLKNAVKTDGKELLEQKELAAILDMNKELIASGNKLMVHSEYTRNNVLKHNLIDEKMVRHINLVEQIDKDSKTIDKKILFKKYGIPSDAFIISSFGYIANTKLNLEIAKVVKKISKLVDIKICYLMVGMGDYADSELEDNLVIKTGYTELDEFNSFVSYSDIVVNLRNPSMGETSAAMLRILQSGKACITNNGGWFSEIPDSCVKKVEIDNIERNLEEALSNLISNENERKTLGIVAKKYVENEFNAETITKQIYEFMAEK